MTEQQIKKQAREMAERCANLIMQRIGEVAGGEETHPIDFSNFVHNTILRELDLESLVADKARLERLEKEFIHAIANKSQPSLFYTTGPITFEGDDFRTAITNAMNPRKE